MRARAQTRLLVFPLARIRLVEPRRVAAALLLLVPTRYDAMQLSSHEEAVTSRSPFTQSCHATLNSPHVGPIMCVRFNHENGDYLVSGGQDRLVQLWNPQKQRHVKAYQPQHGRAVHDVQLTKGNDKFASASADKLCMLWDVTSGDVVRRFRGHDGGVNSLHFNEDDSVIATASYDQTTRLWDARSFSRDAIQVLRDAKDSVSCVRIRGAEIATASMDGCVRRYDLRMGRLTTDHMGCALSSLAWSHDGECLLVSCLDSTRKLVDRSSGAVLQQYHADAKEFAMEACFDDTDAYVIGGDESGCIHAWDIVDAAEVHSYPDAHVGPVTAIDWHPKEKQFASAGVDGNIRFWK